MSSTDSEVEAYLLRTGKWIMKSTLPILAGSMLWTAYLLIVLLTIYIISRRGFTRDRIQMLSLMILTFLLDTAGYISYLYGFYYQNRQILLKGQYEGSPLSAVRESVAVSDDVTSIILMLMLIPGDCIVIWRAHALWTGNRFVIFIPVCLLAGYIVNIPFFANCTTRYRYDLLTGVTTSCVVTNSVAWGLSLAANLSATVMITSTAWRYYVFQRSLKGSEAVYVKWNMPKAGKVLFLLVESGIIYLLVMICSLVLAVYEPPAYGVTTVALLTLNLTCNQLIALIPTVTILLVYLYGSFEESSKPLRTSHSIQFASRSAVESSTMHISTSQIFEQELVDVSNSNDKSSV
ncbi:hypothetical protein C8J56DRAFT_916988 [Mycena floridula]|nr:hypothetical protein C8J56DRAFT_916988 [Mycena floridula]